MSKANENNEPVLSKRKTRSSVNDENMQQPDLTAFNFKKQKLIRREIKKEPGIDESIQNNKAGLKFNENLLNTVNNQIKSELKPKEEPKDVNENWEPENWRELLNRIRQMRVKGDAPVDTMGCDSLSSFGTNLPPESRRYHCLISLMLSSQTKDEVTAKAVTNLQTLPLDIDTILNTSEEKIQQLIYPCSFYKRKAVYLKKTSQILKDEYNNDIPDTIEGLCKLPGVGPKMAYICMSVAWNKTAGIGVDTHVHRISNRLGFTRKTTKIPEQTRKALEEWLPQENWDEINHLFVGFGQTICRPVGPKCATCLANDICPTGKINMKNLIVKKSKTKKIKIEVETEEENQEDLETNKKLKPI